MDIDNKNELQTHQGMDSRHMQKVEYYNHTNSIVGAIFGVEIVMIKKSVFVQRTKITPV